MKATKIIKTFRDRYPYVGPIFWMLSVQYFIIQVIVGLSWTTHYSLRYNYISDLGNTACGIYAGRFICSPLHSLMNASFITLGITMIIGSLLVYHEFKTSKASAIGFSFMAIAGLGSILVGLCPENSVLKLHALGALLVFLIGNLGIVILGYYLALSKYLRFYTLLSGVVSLLALVLFTSKAYLGLGVGGMERVVAYPQTIWLIVFGIYISKNHFARSSK